MWHIALREQREEEKTVSETIHAGLKPAGVLNDDLVPEVPGGERSHRPTALLRPDETQPTNSAGLYAQQPENPNPAQSMPRQDTADSGVVLTTTNDLDLKEQFMSQALHDEGDPLLPVYSTTPQRVELANNRSR